MKSFENGPFPTVMQKRLNKNVFITGLFAGCLYSQLNVNDPLSIDGFCATTCGTNAVVHYLCNQSSPDPVGNATCVAQSTWDQTCTPTGE